MTHTPFTGLMYLSGPIFGVKDFKMTFERGRAAAEVLGFHPVSPLDLTPPNHPGPCPPGRNSGSPHNGPCHMREDLRALVECQAILMLPGWQPSQGANVELMVANAIGLDIYYLYHEIDRVKTVRVN